MVTFPFFVSVVKVTAKKTKARFCIPAFEKPNTKLDVEVC